MKLSKPLKVLKSNILREPWPALASVAVIAMTLVIFNAFVFLIAGSGLVLKYLENKAQISIFFVDTVTEEAIMSKKTELEGDARVSAVKYVSKEEALTIFKELSKDEPALLESLQSNPLPASLEVKAKNIADLETLSEEYKKIEGVEEVKYYKDVVDTFKKWSRSLKIVGLSILVVFSVVSIVIILMTIGMVIHSKGIEVEILRLVGASDKYVKSPLVMQGVLYGVTAAFVSTLLMYLFIPIASRFIDPLFYGVPLGSGFVERLFWAPFFTEGASLVQKIASFAAVVFMELFLGTALGFIGSTLAIKKYLRY